MSNIFTSIVATIGAKGVATKVAVGVLSAALVGGAGFATYSYVKNEETQQAMQEDIKDLPSVTVSENEYSSTESADRTAEFEEQARKSIEETEKENERIMQENAKREAEEQAKKQSVQAIVDRDNERIRAAENNPDKQTGYANPELSQDNSWRSTTGEVATKSSNNEEWNAEDFYNRLNESLQRTLDKQAEKEYRRETGYQGELVNTGDGFMEREAYDRVYGKDRAQYERSDAPAETIPAEIEINLGLEVEE